MKGKRFAWCCILFFAFLEPSMGADLAGIDIHGFISQGFLWSDENNYLGDSEEGSFQFNELGINFSKDLSDELRIGMQIFSRDLGETGNNQVEIDWAYGDYRWRDWLGLRVGLMKMAHGLYNETRDVDMLRTWILLPRSVYEETIRDYYTRMWGGELYGTIPIGVAGNLKYRALIGSYTPDSGESGLTRFVKNEAFPLEVDEFENGVQYNGSLQWQTPLPGLRFAATHWNQKNFSVDIRTNVPLGPDVPAGTPLEVSLKNETTVFSAEYVRNNLTLVAEYNHEDIRYSIPGAPVAPVKQVGAAWYLGAAYRFTDWFELGGYYSENYPDRDDKDGERFTEAGEPDFLAWRKGFALTARFDVTDSWVVKLEGHRINGAAGLFREDHPGGFEEDWHLFAAKASFNF
jgi:hypothetical protein